MRRMRYVARDSIGAMAREIDADLNAIRASVRRPLESRLSAGQLTGPQKLAMSALVASSDGMSLKELCAHLGLAHSTTSGIVDRLEKRGLLERREHEADRRVSRIVVTQ